MTPSKLYSRLVLFTIIIFISTSTYSQHVSLNYYNTGAGQNITGNYTFELKKSALGFGLGYTFNRSIQAESNYKVWHKSQYATEPLQHLNLNIYYHRYIFPNLEHINIFVFYDFQGKHSTAMTKIGSGYFDNEEIYYHGPYFWLENTFGIGFNVNIHGRWYLQQKVGYGALILIPSSTESDMTNASYVIDGFKWEFEWLFNIGIVYRLQSS